MKKYLNNRIFIVGFLVIIFAQIIYISTATANVPLMDYWQYINMFVDKMNESGLSFADIWQNDGIHRSPLQFIYFILNVKLFGYNVRVEEFAGILVMAITALILYKYISCLQSDVKRRNLYGILVTFIIFNLNQYEMISEEFALSFASRMQLFLIGFILTSQYLNNIEKYKKFTFELGVLYIIIVQLVGGGYFPAYLATLCFTIVLNYILRFREDKNKYFKYYAWLLFCIIVSAIIYMHGVNNDSGVFSLTLQNILPFVKSYLTGMIIMLGVSILGFSYSKGITFLIGCIIFIVYLVSFIVYLKNKNYKKTYFPLLAYGYVFCVIGLICLGRFNIYGIDYAYTSRYVCETNVAIMAFAVLCALNKVTWNKDKIKSLDNIGKIVLKSFLVIFVIGIMHSNYLEFNMAPFRKLYGDGLIASAKNIENMTSDDIAQFQCDEQTVRNGIELMKKYDLGIFKYQ